MPFRWHNSVKNFRWQVDDVSGLPTAETEIIGQGLYVMCCPLCGCSHNLRADHAGVGLFEPLCLVNTFASQGGRESGTWKLMRADWLRRYPESANFTKIMLRAAWVKPVPQPEATQARPEPEQQAA